MCEITEETKKRLGSYPQWIKELVLQQAREANQLQAQVGRLTQENQKLSDLLTSKMEETGDSDTFLDRDDLPRLPLGRGATIQFGDVYEAGLAENGDLHINYYAPVVFDYGQTSTVVIQRRGGS